MTEDWIDAPEAERRPGPPDGFDLTCAGCGLIALFCGAGLLVKFARWAFA